MYKLYSKVWPTRRQKMADDKIISDMAGSLPHPQPQKSHDTYSQLPQSKTKQNKSLKHTFVWIKNISLKCKNNCYSMKSFSIRRGGFLLLFTSLNSTRIESIYRGHIITSRYRAHRTRALRAKHISKHGSNGHLRQNVFTEEKLTTYEEC